MKKDKMAKNTPKSDTSTNTTTRKATISDGGKVNDNNLGGDEVKEEQHPSKEHKCGENLNGQQTMKHKIQIINKKCASSLAHGYNKHGQNSLSKNKNDINNKKERSVSIGSLFGVIVYQKKK
eukprot:10366_1